MKIGCNEKGYFVFVWFVLGFFKFFGKYVWNIFEFGEDVCGFEYYVFWGVGCFVGVELKIDIVFGNRNYWIFIGLVVLL